MFINLQRALCAATGCDLQYMTEHVWPWVCTQKEAHGSGPRTEQRGIEWLEEKWQGFKTSTIGADYIYRLAARQFHHQEAIDAITDTTDLFGAPEDPGEDVCRAAIWVRRQRQSG